MRLVQFLQVDLGVSEVENSVSSLLIGRLADGTLLKDVLHELNLIEIAYYVIRP